MPYIKSEKREIFDLKIRQLIEDLKKDPDNVEGNLNYIVSSIISGYLDGKLNYKNINSMIGSLECAKIELYHRVAVPYEEKKSSENGDVYGNLIKE